MILLIALVLLSDGKITQVGLATLSRNGGCEKFVVAVKSLKSVSYIGKISATRFSPPFLSIHRFYGNRPIDTKIGTITVSRSFSQIAIPLEPGLLQKGEAAWLLWTKRV